MYALVQHDQVWELFDQRPDYADLFDVRDVTKVKGIDIGWIAESDGSFSAPKPVEAPQTVPASINRAQAKIQLSRMDGSAKGKTLLDDAVAAVDAAGGELAIWFADSPAWQRSSPYVAQLAKALGLKKVDIDALFQNADQIQA